MANPTTGFGLQAVNRWDNANPNWSRNTYPVLYTYATAMAKGDLAIINASTGNLERYASAGSVTVGVIDQFRWYDTVQKKMVYSSYWPGPASTIAGGVLAWVIDDPNVEFIGRVSGAAVTATKVGENADIVTTAPDATTGLSVETINSTTNTTANFPLKVLGVYESPGNDNTLDNNIIRVKLNATIYTTTTGIA